MKKGLTIGLTAWKLALSDVNDSIQCKEGKFKCSFVNNAAIV